MKGDDAGLVGGRILMQRTGGAAGLLSRASRARLVAMLLLAALALDSDNDGRSDLEELVLGNDPFDPLDGPDIDGDGIPNGEEPDVAG